MSDGVDPTSSSPQQKSHIEGLPSVPETAYSKSFSLKGKTELTKWFMTEFPSMNQKQASKAANQFLMGIIKNIQHTMANALKKEKAAATRLKQSEQ